MNITEEKIKAEKNLQLHLNKVIRAITQNEVVLMGTDDMPIQTMIALFKENEQLEHLAQWIINLGQKNNPQKIIPQMKPRFKA